MYDCPYIYLRNPFSEFSEVVVLVGRDQMIWLRLDHYNHFMIPNCYLYLCNVQQLHDQILSYWHFYVIFIGGGEGSASCSVKKYFSMNLIGFLIHQHYEVLSSYTYIIFVAIFLPYKEYILIWIVPFSDILIEIIIKNLK